MTTEAPAARHLLNEADVLAPRRSRRSDGILPSRQHTTANPTSYHERGDAVDLTHDPAAGIDCAAIAERIRQRAIAGLEKRAVELIHNRRIATEARGWAWRPYDGKNPHTTHLHVSIRHSRRGSLARWFDELTPDDEDLTMTPENANALRQIIREEVQAGVRTILGKDIDGKDADPTHYALNDLRRDVAQDDR